MKTKAGYLRMAVAVAGMLLPSLVFAQIKVTCHLPRTDYLAYEPMEMEVNITNYTAYPIELENKDGKPWLEVMITKPSGELVAASKQLDLGTVTVNSGQTVMRRLNLAQLFEVGLPGRYRAQVTVTTPDGKEFRAATRPISVSNGVMLWEGTVGVETPSSEKPAAEQFRTYTLLQFTAQGEPHSLYLRVEDKSNGIIYGVFSLGTFLSFVKPQARIDKDKNLHLLFQSGSRLFDYLRIDPNARLVERQVLTNFTSQPRLMTTEDGRVFVSGGERMRTN